jgi:hypothetical protein
MTFEVPITNTNQEIEFLTNVGTGTNVLLSPPNLPISTIITPFGGFSVDVSVAYVSPFTQNLTFTTITTP